MKILISPAKSLDFKTTLPTKRQSEAIFLKESQKLITVLKEKSPRELGQLMSISDSLADLNWQRNQEWSLPFEFENSRQAVYAFKGDVYKGLDAYTIPDEKLNQLEDKLRILSGLYGVLKPFDLIRAYRLEMGTKLIVDTAKNLYEFWANKITEVLNDEMQPTEVLLNLASNEYYKVIQPKLLKGKVVSPQFKDYKNGQLKIISFYAKKARGMMVRYILDYDVDELSSLKGFDYGGYAYNEELSSETEPVFVR